MNIGLLGYGKMGKLIEALCHEQTPVLQVFDENRPLTRDLIDLGVLSDVDCLIDFSTPTAALENIDLACYAGKNLVIGTTGWSDSLETVRKQVDEAGIGLVYASNFSLGVNIFYQMVAHASKIMARFDAYDPYLYEAHHRQKLDAPSGTALNLKILVEEAYAERKLDVAATRCGSIPGTHEVGFDSAADTITLRHQARNREGFANGAILAAKWIDGRQGFYSFSDIVQELVFEQS